MAKAKTRVITPRKTASKKTDKKAAPNHSEIIKQCVIYMQSTAGFEAGHDADATGSGDIAGDLLGGVLLQSAEDALDTMVGLRSKANKPPLTVAELRSMAITCRAALDFDAGSSLTEGTGAFVRLFAGEVDAYLRAVDDAERKARAESKSKAGEDTHV